MSPSLRAGYFRGVSKLPVPKLLKILLASLLFGLIAGLIVALGTEVLALRSSDQTFTGHRLTVHTAAVIKRFSTVAPGAMDAVGRHPRLDWAGQCPTLRAGTGSDKGSYQSVRPLHPEEPRVITVRESARLQGFPDSHRFHPTVWHSSRMIGNSVSPIIAKVIFSAIAAKLQVTAQAMAA